MNLFNLYLCSEILAGWFLTLPMVATIGGILFVLFIFFCLLSLALDLGS